MRLSQLLNKISILPAQCDPYIAGITLDSRKIKQNELFVAIKGKQFDGTLYIKDAISKGAIAVLIESDYPTIVWQEQIPIIPIPLLKEKLGNIAARFYTEPAKKLNMMGVTGTNGKTSCTHFIAQSLQSLNIACGIIGTLGNGFQGELSEPGLTTPDAITLHATLKDFVSKGAQAVAMEVSSHSIDQGRINGIEFNLGIFTNLTQDHLDYHGDMEVYANVKRRFFAELPVKELIINADDAYGAKWIAELSSQKSIYIYSTQPNLKTNHPHTYAENIRTTHQGIETHLVSPWGETDLIIPLIGRFNLSNVLAVFTALCVNQIPFSIAIKQISQLIAVPGRMQTLQQRDKPLVVVDYSHTPDSLEKALQALRPHTEGKLFCVFGCGGDRDQTKRPIMGKVAEKWADQVIITNDNPRHEIPEEIAKQILSGFLNPMSVIVELNRSKAIEKSIQWAKANDCILIAGKGAEHYMQVGDKKIPFDDVEQALKFL